MKSLGLVARLALAGVILVGAVVIAFTLYAATVKVSTHTLTNSDGSHDSGYPFNTKATALAWSKACLDTALAPIASQSIALTTSIAIDTASGCLSGDLAASAVLSFVQASDGLTSCAAQWNVTGTTPNRALTDSGPSAGAGSCKLKAVYQQLSVLSNAYPWNYVGLPADPLAPPVPTRLTATGSAGQIVISGDTPWDACGASVCKGAQDIQLQKDGSGTLATVTVASGLSCNPTATNVGVASGATATQTGLDWSVSSSGQAFTTADSYEVVTCAVTGASYIGVLVNAFSGDTSGNPAACVEVRASPTDPGSIKGAGCLIYNPGTSTYVFSFVHRDTTNASRVHSDTALSPPPVCLFLDLHADHTISISTSTVTSGQCNNDQTERVTNYALTLPATSYLALSMTSNTGDALVSTASFKQLNINNQTRWLYTDSTSGTHTYAAKGRDQVPNASALSPTVSATSISTNTRTRWNPGMYGDCSAEMPHGGDDAIALGNADYNAAIACMDYWATQTPVAKGVFLPMTWSSFEGDTAGCYDTSCTNKLSGGATGKIGYPLMDALLSYAASKGLKVLIGVDWFHFGGYGGCNYDPVTNFYAQDAWFPAYLRHTGVCDGTDAAGTYGVLTWSRGLVPHIWKAAVMDKFIALLAAYCVRYDGNRALESFLMMTEEGDLPSDSETTGAGYTAAAFTTQQARIQAAVKPSCPHTNIELSMEWVDPASGGASMMLAGYNTPTSAMGYYQNDLLPSATLGGQAIFAGYVGVGNASTHDFRGQLPVTVKTSDELCGMISVYGTQRYPNSTPQQFWDVAFTTGSTDTGVALRPSHWIFSRITGPAYCPSVVNQQWGTASSGGMYQFVLGHPWPANAAACPTAYTGLCDSDP